MKIKLFSAVILVALLVSACSASVSTPVPQSSGGATSGTQIMITNFKFDPDTVTIKVGGTVTWTNQDTVVHNVAFADGSWKSPDIAKGASASYTFTKPGTYTYICAIHPKMTGTIIVQ